MPMALVIQSSEPTQGPKMPQGLVISGLRNPEQADNTASKTVSFAFNRLVCPLLPAGFRPQGLGLGEAVL